MKSRNPISTSKLVLSSSTDTRWLPLLNALCDIQKACEELDQALSVPAYAQRSEDSSVELSGRTP